MNTVTHAPESSNASEILIGEREAAKRLSLSTRTLYALRTAGQLPHVRIGTKVLYAPDDLAAFAASRRQTVEARP
jgi:excisionase family DNA binding protein